MVTKAAELPNHGSIARRTSTAAIVSKAAATYRITGGCSHCLLSRSASLGSRRAECAMLLPRDARQYIKQVKTNKLIHSRCVGEPGICQIDAEKKHKASVKIRMLFVAKSNDEDPRFHLR